MGLLSPVVQTAIAAVLAIAGTILTMRARSPVRQLAGLTLFVGGAWFFARAYLPADVPGAAATAEAASGSGPPSFAVLLVVPVLLAAGFLLRKRDASS